MAIDKLFELDSVIQAARNTKQRKGIIKAIHKNNEFSFSWYMLENPHIGIIESATIMRDREDGEQRAIIVLYVDNLEKLRAESTLRELNDILDKLLTIL